MSLRSLRSPFVFAAAVAAIFAAATGVAVAQEHASPSDHGPSVGAAHGSPRAEAEGHPSAHEPGHETGHETASHGGHHGPEAINWTDVSNKHKPAFIALVVNFGLLVGLYYTLGKKPVTEGLKQRRVNIGKDIEEAQKLLGEAQERAKKYQGDLKNADADAETARATLVSGGKGEAERLLSDAAEKADRMRRDAERLVEQERKQLQQDLLVETIGLAVDEATVLLSKSVSADDHARLAQDLLAEFAKHPSAKRDAVGGAS